MFRRLLCVAAFAAATLPAHAQPIETSGVKYEPTVQVADKTLQLNGAGTRYKAVFKVYAAGLYLAAKADAPAAVLATPGPKRMHLVMLREIDGNELGKLFTRAMQDNTTREEFVKVIPGTIRMGEIFSTRAKLATGDAISIDWVPGTGTVITINGKQADTGAPIKEPEFYNAMLKIWIGSKPADHLLKDALLGKPKS